MLTDVISVLVIPVTFSCTILNNNRLLSNIYYIKLGIDPIASAADNIGIGLQRINHLVDYHLQSSIFLEQNHAIAKELDKLHNNLVYFPCDTYDIFVGSVLLTKFQAITEKYFDIQYVTIASLIGENIQYNILNPYDTQLDLEGNHWWNQDNVYTGSREPQTWDELNLTEAPKFKPTIVKGGLSET